MEWLPLEETVSIKRNTNIDLYKNERLSGYKTASTKKCDFHENEYLETNEMDSSKRNSFH